MENTPQLQENKYYILNDNNSKGPAYKLNELMLLKRNGIITKDTLIIKDSDTPKPAGAFLIFNDNYTINTSGTGNSAKLPKELNTFNIGACILSIFWGYSHFPKYRIHWIALIVIFFLLGGIIMPLIQITLPIIPIIFLTKGNEIAWKNRRFNSIEEFKTIQDKWLQWSYGIIALFFLMFFYLIFTNL